MDQDDLDQDLVRSKSRLEDLIGQEVKGYRAPSFSVSEAILARIYKAGYTYDSSYNSFALHPRYGKMDFATGLDPNGIATQVSEGFFELPVSNLRLGKKVVPWGGGGYFRLIPGPLFTWGARKIVRTDGAYVLYLHPWEFDPDQPRVKEVSWQLGFRHYVNLKKTEAKLKRLIQRMSDCCFVSCSDYLGLELERGRRNISCPLR
jgi:polysaccharide deacetylase family protein (PEP-CTERM system associated)